MKTHSDYRVIGINDGNLKTTSEEVVYFECSKIEYEDSSLTDSLKYRFNRLSVDNFVFPKDPKLNGWLEKAGPAEEIVSINMNNFTLIKENSNGEVKNYYYYKSLNIPHDNKYVIKPTYGVGDLIFGLDSNEIKSILGSPDEIKKHETSIKTIYTWNYGKLGLTLLFSTDNFYFLEKIQINKKGFLFLGNDLIDMNLLELKANQSSYGIDDLTFRARKSNIKEIYSSVEKKLVFEIVNDKVASFYVCPIIENNGFELEIKWPIAIDKKAIIIPKET